MNQSNNNNEGAVQPSTEATSASASINPNTNPTTMKESDSMNASNNTLVAGATVNGIVESKNQHGATLSIAGEVAFLPVAQMGETSISDLAKGTELAVTVTDTDGAKPRVAIASPDVTSQTPVETEDTVKAFEPTSDATVESETADETAGDEDLSASIAKLAATWGASVRVESGTRKPSSKPSKKSAAPRKAAVEAPVAKPVETPVVEVAEVAEQPKVVETAPADSPKLAFLKTLKVGDEVKASVKFKKDFGAFMTVDKLGFGLLHVSEMPGAKPEQRKAYLEGLRYKQEVTAHVISIDLKEERLGLSLVAGEKTSFFRDLAVGSIVEGTISGTKEIGAFINLGVTTGFLHVSEVEGDSRELRDAKLATYSKGDKLELVVVDVNREKQEVRLSQRRLALAALQQGDEVQGWFVHVRDNVVVLDLSTGGRGYLPKQKGMPRFENGAVVTAKVKSVDVARGAVELV